MKWTDSIYQKTAALAATPYAVTALVIIAFFDSCIIGVSPIALLVPLCVARKHQWKRLSIIATTAATAGALAAYLIGWGLWNLANPFFFQYVPGFSVENFLYVQHLCGRWNFVIGFAGIYMPIPYSLFCIAAGVLGIDPTTFILASACGRFLRCFAMAWLAARYGERILRLFRIKPGHVEMAPEV